MMSNIYTIRLILLIFLLLNTPGWCFHDCIQASRHRKSQIRKERADSRRRQQSLLDQGKDDTNLPPRTFIFGDDGDDDGGDENCADGLCVGMTNGPHQGGNASYPVLWDGEKGTSVFSVMTVPALPKHFDDITYYIWTDIFFGDMGRGRMNQMVPQLILGDALDGSTGPPEYKPLWGTHHTWIFGAHYYFEIASSSADDRNEQNNITESHAAYGEMHPAFPGETLFTSFDLLRGIDEDSPKWVLTMGVLGDSSRLSKLEIQKPYMGIGTDWPEHPSTRWTEPNYRNICINACWELYGARDTAHLPSSGASYHLQITQPAPNSYEFTTWERDEGNGLCPSVQVKEHHTNVTQKVQIDIQVVEDGKSTVK